MFTAFEYSDGKPNNDVVDSIGKDRIGIGLEEDRIGSVG